MIEVDGNATRNRMRRLRRYVSDNLLDQDKFICPAYADAIAAGASVLTIQRMLGHASAAITLDRYGHLMGDELDAVAETLHPGRAAHVPQVCPQGDTEGLPGTG